MELWRTIEEFPEYEVSNSGRIRSNRGKNSRFLSGTKHKLGYVGFILRKPGSKKPFRRELHRLMAKAFIPNPMNLSDVAHNDGQPSHNSIDNLRWSTHRDNIMDSRLHGTMPDGEKCVTSKLKSDQVLEIRARLAKGEVGRKICKEYGISQGQISKIGRGERWAALLSSASPL